MSDKVTLVLATRNKGKTVEMQDMLKDFPVIIKNLDDLGPIPEVIEDGETFEENAYKKASFTARVLGMPALADDSGLVVDALGGEPGVYSARYAGEDATSKDNCKKLIENLKGIENRKASFKCVVSIAVPGGAALTYEGSCDGVITEEPKGSSGFGYDPYFYYPEFGKTFAELTLKEKSEVSHRGLAFHDISNEFDKIMTWINQNMPVFVKSGCVGSDK